MEEKQSDLKITLKQACDFFDNLKKEYTNELSWDDIYFEFNKQTGKLRTEERNILINWLKINYLPPKLR